MLKLSRKLHEKIKLILEDGREILIEVTMLKRSRTIIGIEAPKSIKIIRTELLERQEVLDEGN